MSSPFCLRELVLPYGIASLLAQTFSSSSFFFFLESLMATGKKGLADSSSISNAVLLKLVVCFEPGQSLSGVFISSQP